MALEINRYQHIEEKYSVEQGDDWLAVRLSAQFQPGQRVRFEQPAAKEGEGTVVDVRRMTQFGTPRWEFKVEYDHKPRARWTNPKWLSAITPTPSAVASADDTLTNDGAAPAVAAFAVGDRVRVTDEALADLSAYIRGQWEGVTITIVKVQPVKYNAYTVEHPDGGHGIFDADELEPAAALSPQSPANVTDTAAEGEAVLDADGIRAWIRDIIEGGGGLHALEEYEGMVFKNGRDVGVADWVVRCLGNSTNPHTDGVVKAIVERRWQQRYGNKPIPSDNDVHFKLASTLFDNSVLLAEATQANDEKRALTADLATERARIVALEAFVKRVNAVKASELSPLEGLTLVWNLKREALALIPPTDLTPPSPDSAPTADVDAPANDIPERRFQNGDNVTIKQGAHTESIAAGLAQTKRALVTIKGGQFEDGVWSYSVTIPGASGFDVFEESELEPYIPVRPASKYNPTMSADEWNEPAETTSGRAIASPFAKPTPAPTDVLGALKLGIVDEPAPLPKLDGKGVQFSAKVDAMAERQWKQTQGAMRAGRELRIAAKDLEAGSDIYDTFIKRWVTLVRVEPFNGRPTMRVLVVDDAGAHPTMTRRKIDSYENQTWAARPPAQPNESAGSDADNKVA